jgi:hypothetical protein
LRKAKKLKVWKEEAPRREALREVEERARLKQNESRLKREKDPFDQLQEMRDQRAKKELLVMGSGVVLLLAGYGAWKSRATVKSLLKKSLSWLGRAATIAAEGL